jgi:prepilin-type processing-associated H-X9-DG protein
MSSVGPRADTAGNVVDVGAEALNGYLQVVFADGHLEKLPRAQVPTNVLSVGTNNYNRLFWIGLE